MIIAAGADEEKERRNGVSTMKCLNSEVVLPCKEAQFTLIYTCCSLHCTIIIHLPLSSCYSVFHKSAKYFIGQRLFYCIYLVFEAPSLQALP